MLSLQAFNIFFKHMQNFLVAKHFSSIFAEKKISELACPSKKIRIICCRKTQLGIEMCFKLIFHIFRQRTFVSLHIMYSFFALILIFLN